MGLMHRRKGAIGQGIAANLLKNRDYVVDQLTAGISSADFVATDKDGKTWLVEVKNTAVISNSHLKQAIEQGKSRRLPWMLMNKIHGSSSWLIRRQGGLPVVWHEKEN